MDGYQEIYYSVICIVGRCVQQCNKETAGGGKEVEQEATKTGTEERKEEKEEWVQEMKQISLWFDQCM